MKIFFCELQSSSFFVKCKINFYIIKYYRPLIKLTDRLLLVGVLTDEDVVKLLLMIDPETWDEAFIKGICIFLMLLCCTNY